MGLLRLSTLLLLIVALSTQNLAAAEDTTITLNTTISRNNYTTASIKNTTNDATNELFTRDATIAADNLTNTTPNPNELSNASGLVNVVTLPREMSTVFEFSNKTDNMEINSTTEYFQDVTNSIGSSASTMITRRTATSTSACIYLIEIVAFLMPVAVLKL